MRPLLALGLSALSLVCSPLLASETVSNQQLGVRLSVPDGFVSVPEKVGGDLVFSEKLILNARTRRARINLDTSRQLKNDGGP
jgi:hypothetical protein